MIHTNVSGHAQAIAKAAGFQLHAADACISRTEHGVLLGGAVFQNYTGRSVSSHLAGFSPHWINRDLLWTCFHYCFVQLQCEYLFGRIPSGNLKALELDTKLGFKEVARVPDFYPGQDEIVMRMGRAECRWLALKPRGIRPN